MRFVMFYHSIVSDWNHGNAHFLRGVVSELLARGHDVHVYEPRSGWSLQNLCQDQGSEPVREFKSVYPQLQPRFYDLETLDLDAALEDADVVIVHEWNERELVRRIGRHRGRTGGYRLLFHDTHHRCVTDEANMASYDLSHYDGVLVFGEMIREVYLTKGWAQHVWTWHEAAHLCLFHPISVPGHDGDLVWIGNWGDEERTRDLGEFLLDPVRELGLQARVHGVRYPASGVAALESAGIDYRGWIPNHRVPETFARFRVTVHIPRRPYREILHGIPTIRVFEALACGIPLVCAAWNDIENLFSPGRDYLVARNGREMQRHLRAILSDADLARELTAHGRRTILARHTCAHRVDELLSICRALDRGTATEDTQVARATLSPLAAPK